MNGQLKLTKDRKMSPEGRWQQSRRRWIATIPSSFGLPSKVSCPGATSFCVSCYGTRSEQSAGVQDALDWNLNLLLTAGTVEGMAELLDDMLGRYVTIADRRRVAVADRVFRIHWDGDFFSAEYAAAWATVIRRYPQISFWAYTRSFTGPVDVVPVLERIPNLRLYLSTDADNVDAALDQVARHPDVLLAGCGVDYRRARELVGDRKAYVCPENAERMPLMVGDHDGVGRGACLDCRICVDGRADVLFSTSHRHDIEAVTVTIGESKGRCRQCRGPLPPQAGGRPREFCTKTCRWVASRARARARQAA